MDMKEQVAKAAEIVLGEKALYLSVFPEIAGALTLLMKSQGSPGCTKCSRYKYANNLLSALTMAPKEGREISKLPDKGCELLKRALSNVPGKARTIVKADPDEERDGCPDCVRKHLSQALILMDEVVQGYPEHIRLALGHSEKALRCSTGKGNDKPLSELRDALLKLSSETSAQEGLEYHMDRARTLMQSYLTSDGSPISLWRVIGHLGEAADECVKDSPDLARRIRAERLALMSDHEYRPPLAMLLNEARKIK